ncbi:MAG TPA: ABC transporter substrate-binding protein [Candidatus Binatia bacterium]|jgi:NitT/TauT family transport system substrate-binding protein
MKTRSACLLAALAAFLLSISSTTQAQPGAKKIRMGISTTSIVFLPFYAAVQKGFYKDEGIDLELIVMSATLASTAVLTGDVDYNGAVTGVIGAAVQGRPLKVLIFTADRPLSFLMAKKEIKGGGDLKGKRVAGSSPGGSATLLARLAMKHFGLDADRDVSIMPMGGGDGSRLAALESGVADATILGIPFNIYAFEKGYSELVFFGDIMRFPQTGFGTSERKIREHPDEVLKMVRATLRGLMFTWEEKHRDEILDLVMKRLKIGDRKLAGEIFRHLRRGLTRDASVEPEGIQALIDLARENARVSKPVTVARVVDYTFVEKARKELAIQR